jgi:hypothetical protein
VLLVALKSTSTSKEINGCKARGKEKEKKKEGKEIRNENTKEISCRISTGNTVHRSRVDPCGG